MISDHHDLARIFPSIGHKNDKALKKELRAKLSPVQLAALANMIVDICLRGSPDRPPIPMTYTAAADLVGTDTRTMRHLNATKRKNKKVHDQLISGDISRREAMRRVEDMDTTISPTDIEIRPIIQTAPVKDPKALAAARKEVEALKKRNAELEEMIEFYQSSLESAYAKLVSDVETKVNFYNRYVPGGPADRTVFTKQDFNTIVSALHPDKVARFGDKELTESHQAAADLVIKKKVMLLRPEQTEEKKPLSAPTASEMFAKLYASKADRKDAVRFKERAKFLFPSVLADQVIEKFNAMELNNGNDC